MTEAVTNNSAGLIEKSIVGKYFFSCATYAVLSHTILEISYPGLDLFQSSVRSLTIYSLMFSTVAAIPLILSVLIGKIPRKNRVKPYFSYFNTAMIFTWIIASAGLYLSWSANRITLQSNESSVVDINPTEAEIDGIVKEEIERISNQTPIVIDGNTTLVAASFINSGVHFLYSFQSLDAQDVNKEQFTENIIKSTRNRFCTDPNAKLFRTVAGETIINWKYVDAKGVVISNFSMKGADCGEP